MSCHVPQTITLPWIPNHDIIRPGHANIILKKLNQIVFHHHSGCATSHEKRPISYMKKKKSYVA